MVGPPIREGDRIIDEDELDSSSDDDGGDGGGLFGAIKSGLSRADKAVGKAREGAKKAKESETGQAVGDVFGEMPSGEEARGDVLMPDPSEKGDQVEGVPDELLAGSDDEPGGMDDLLL